MKVSCSKQRLLEAVTNIQRAVSTKSSIPALEGIFIQAKDSCLELCGYDLEFGMTTALEGQIIEPGRIVLSARLFGDIVRRLPAEDVLLTVDDKNMTTIVSGASEFSIAGIPAEEYPDLPVIHGDHTMELPQALLRSMIRQTLFAVAETDAKPIHTGVLFEQKDRMLRLVAVDGYRLAVREEAMPSDAQVSFVVPGKTLSEVLRLLKEDENTLTIQISSRHILFTIDRYTLISRLLEGEFLDYRSALPKTHQTEIVVRTRALMESVERVSLLISDRMKSPVRCIFADGEIKLSCSTPMGRATDQVEAEITGASVEMGFNNRYLLDALRNAETDEVLVRLNGALAPMLLTPREGTDFRFLVLPVRLSEG